MQAAYAAAGITISRTTYDQVRDGAAVPDLAHLNPGDLVLIPGSDGTMSAPGHVGMFVGTDSGGTGYVLHAPYTGTYIQVARLAAFGPIAALRRIAP
jgi:cell wall-associated NlpC family hydrolase